VFDPAIRDMVITGLVETDRFFARVFKRALERGELPASADPQVLALLASATLHTIAVRARAKVPRAELDAIVKGALDVICGK
jgi:AcrR family transcriptional regulator